MGLVKELAGHAPKSMIEITAVIGDRVICTDNLSLLYRDNMTMILN